MINAFSTGRVCSLLRPGLTSSASRFLRFSLVGLRNPTNATSSVCGSPLLRVRYTSAAGHKFPILHKRTAKVATTPSRLFKLILPLPILAKKSGERVTAEHSEAHQTERQIALLIHPAQPLSYLASLIENELPPLDSGRAPTVNFYTPVNYPAARNIASQSEIVIPQRDAEGKGLKTSSKSTMALWSGSTEIGDFVRDAAATPEEEAAGIEGGFLIALESHDEEGIWVYCPSFNDRTYYLRARYKRISREIKGMLELKEKCDDLARASAQRMAFFGFGGLVAWWGLVYFLTFVQTDKYGWSVVEPVTYLVGLTTIAGGYLFFLAKNREVSYRSLLHATISRRQMALYEQHGFDVERWQELLDDGREVRREIKRAAAEYGVRWDGKVDATDDLNASTTKEDEEAAKKVEKVLKKKDREDTRRDDDSAEGGKEGDKSDSKSDKE